MFVCCWLGLRVGAGFENQRATVGNNSISGLLDTVDECADVVAVAQHDPEIRVADYLADGGGNAHVFGVAVQSVLNIEGHGMIPFYVFVFGFGCPAGLAQHGCCRNDFRLELGELLAEVGDALFSGLDRGLLLRDRVGQLLGDHLDGLLLFLVELGDDLEDR